MNKIAYLVLTVFIVIGIQTINFCDEGSKAEIPDLPSTHINSNFLQLKVAIEEKQYGPAEPILISVAIKNIDDVTTDVPIGSEFCRNFHLSVFRNGKKAPYTEYMSKIQNDPINKGLISSGKMISLSPGKTLENHRLINRYYDMSICGEYVISATCSFTDFQNQRTCNATSNSVTVEISDKHSSFTSFMGTKYPGSKQSVK